MFLLSYFKDCSFSHLFPHHIETLIFFITTNWRPLWLALEYDLPPSPPFSIPSADIVCYAILFTFTSMSDVFPNDEAVWYVWNVVMRNSLWNSYKVWGERRGGSVLVNLQSWKPVIVVIVFSQSIICHSYDPCQLLTQQVMFSAINEMFPRILLSS